MNTALEGNLRPFGKPYKYEYQHTTRYRSMRRVYDVHCRTQTIARAIHGGSDVTRVDMSKPMPNDAMFRFRCVPAYRSAEALALRKQVADIIRSERC